MTEPWEAHVKRVEFRLTYDRCDSREFSPDGLFGPRIPDAYGRPGENAPGEWFSGDALNPEDGTITDRQWFAHWAQMAVNEAIHEALEWYRVDGTPWLDPHGSCERAIYAETAKLCRKLADMADGITAQPNNKRSKGHV